MSARLAIEARVRRYFHDQVHVEVPSADADLFACGALDSLALVDLVVTLEEELGTRISLERLEVSDFRSIARIAEVLSTWERRP
jgi:acyl carrier protein